MGVKENGNKLGKKLAGQKKESSELWEKLEKVAGKDDLLFVIKNSPLLARKHGKNF